MYMEMYSEVSMSEIADGPGISVAEVRRRLPQLLREVEGGEGIRITRRGRPVAVLLSVEEYERLRRRRPSFRAALARFREQVGEGEGLDLDVPRDPSPGREVEL